MAVITTVLIAGHAAAISVDGQWNDWFSYAGTMSNDWNQSAAAGSLLNPNFRYGNDPDSDASGGQGYDAEQIFYYYEDFDANALSGGMLYIGLVTGYSPTNTQYRSGDLFIDLGGEGTFDLAVATGTENSGRFGDIWQNDGWYTRPVAVAAHSGSEPYRVRESRSGAIAYGTAQIDWDFEVGPGKAHNFLEIGLNVEGSLESLLTNGIGLHWTMQCGNDAIDAYDYNPLTSIPTPPPAAPIPASVPIPAPATLVLLGMSTASMFLRRSRPLI